MLNVKTMTGLTVTGALLVCIGMIIGRHPTAGCEGDHNILTAEGIRIVNKQGSCVMECGSIQGSTYLSLRDSSGKHRLTLSLDPEGRPSLNFMDGDGKRRGLASANKRNDFSIDVSSPDGASATMSAAANGAVGLMLIDKNDIVRSSLDLYPDGAQQLVITGVPPERKITLAVAKDGNAEAIIKSRDGEVRKKLE